MTKWPILLAAAACLMPATALAQKEMSDRIGEWTLVGKGGDCMIMSGSPDTGLVAVASPATGGENSGGLFLSRDGLSVPNGPGVGTVTISGNTAWDGAHSVGGVSEISAFWVAFPDARTVEGFADRWSLTVERDGKTEIQASVSGFRAANAALKRCVTETR